MRFLTEKQGKILLPRISILVLHNQHEASFCPLLLICPSAIVKFTKQKVVYDACSLTTKIKVRLTGVFWASAHAHFQVCIVTDKNISLKIYSRLVVHVYSRQHVSISEDKVRLLYTIKRMANQPFYVILYCIVYLYSAQ